MALTAPPTPTIDPPDEEDCCDPCDDCCAELVTEASIDIPANWGSLIYTGVTTLPAACWNPADGACVGSFPFAFPADPAVLCDGCADITARTVLFDFVAAEANCPGGVFSSCSTGLYPTGTYCKRRFIQWNDLFYCCSPSQFSSGNYNTNTGNMVCCAELRISKHADDASCRIYLFLSVTVTMNCGFSGDSTSLRGTRVYASDLLAGDCCGTFTLTDSRTRSGTAIAGSCGSLCDAMPTSFDVTVTC